MVSPIKGVKLAYYLIIVTKITHKNERKVTKNNNKNEIKSRHKHKGLRHLVGKLKWGSDIIFFLHRMKK